ncbi:uncharacterized protein N7483_010116 [Penicillium malachiteum]|uniref:uncharacterized protein n=1 Tax=Penicillium malachiteum TaxID=1324776 RepID=UPI0025476048|nr:uncharacterized protein N7483_010116 [Penicillium malachiteum]KAJ5712935.1 hypothetical protein N7483_010116 [Penicillium malachiteum]
MSTFDGIVSEFPEIQIDYFRKSDDRAPLACFLSHVHSDHLQGLESFRSPFIYCSPATRELLMKIEKYPHRMNFQKGILESRQLSYKHLAKILRPIPLNTPTDIELTPKKHVRITLFDANHCTGAVMFLIEGDGKSILYTGDIRAEKWWINALARHPILIPYTLGRRRLDKIYLDTTFAGSSDPLREFPTKAQGVAELLEKVEKYPPDTTFYFRSWTFGYEEVWLALSAALNSKVHLDQYQMGLYRSLGNSSSDRGTNDFPALCGFQLGNHYVTGCLSADESSRIHSCEPGVSCKAARSPDTVYITPIVNRTLDGTEIPEVGAGGGAGDLYQVHELELPDESALANLEKLCAKHIPDPEALAQTRTALAEAFKSRKKTLSLRQYGVQDEQIPLQNLVTKISQGHSEAKEETVKSGLPNSIRFPYSRHSSYSELCELVATLRPKDIHPCTVDPSSWSEAISIQSLFGHLCSGDKFLHDSVMREKLDSQYEDDRHLRKRPRYDDDLSTQTSEASSVSGESVPNPNTTSQPEPLPPSTIPDQVRKNRKEIRKAHRYLQENADPELQIGSLPSSFPTEESKDSLTSQDNLKPSFGGDGTCSPRPEPAVTSSLLESQKTDAMTLPISESFLVSTPVDADAALHSDFSPERTRSSDRNLRYGDGRRRVMARLRGRIAAYLATSDSPYSAYQDRTLMSTGAKHSEKDKDL